MKVYVPFTNLAIKVTHFVHSNTRREVYIEVKSHTVYYGDGSSVTPTITYSLKPHEAECFLTKLHAKYMIYRCNSRYFQAIPK